jgi:hypothetical protein
LLQGLRYLLMALAVAGMLGGCAALPPPEPVRVPVPEAAAPEAEREPGEVPPAELTMPQPVVDLEEILRFAAREEPHVAGRLDYYRQEEERWRQLTQQLDGLVGERQRPARWGECLDRLAEAAAGFQAVREMLHDLEFGDASRWSETVSALSAAYRADLAFIGDDCGEYYRLAELTVAARLDRFHASAAEQLEAAMLHHARQGRVEEVQQTLRDWRRIYPARSLPFPLLEKMSIALFRAGKTGETLSLLREQEEIATAEGLAAPTALIRLRADLLLLAGRDQEARSHYEAIAARHAALEDERHWVSEQLRLLRGEFPVSPAERELFLALLRDAILSDGRVVPPSLVEHLRRLERRFPTGMLTIRARMLVAEVESRSEAWFADQLAGVEKLLAEEDFAQAVARLQALQADNLTPDQRARVGETLTLAESSRQEADQRRWQMEQQTVTSQWEEANRLLGLRRFDEAITVFSGLLGSAYADESRRLIREASQEAAAELRREAAGLFVRARRSDNPERAREFAVESWTLLRRIVSRYPDSDIIPRVWDNLVPVEEFLESLEPGLVDRLQEEEAAAQRDPVAGEFPG